MAVEKGEPRPLTDYRRDHELEIIINKGSDNLKAIHDKAITARRNYHNLRDISNDFHEAAYDYIENVGVDERFKQIVKYKVLELKELAKNYSIDITE